MKTNALLIRVACGTQLSAKSNHFAVTIKPRTLAHLTLIASSAAGATPKGAMTLKVVLLMTRLLLVRLQR